MHRRPADRADEMLPFWLGFRLSATGTEAPTSEDMRLAPKSNHEGGCKCLYQDRKP
jgi:hypothetical protein